MSSIIGQRAHAPPSLRHCFDHRPQLNSVEVAGYSTLGVTRAKTLRAIIPSVDIRPAGFQTHPHRHMEMGTWVWDASRPGASHLLRRCVSMPLVRVRRDSIRVVGEVRS